MFSGRDFGKTDVEGYQLRVVPGKTPWPWPERQDELLLNPAATKPLSSCPVIWPQALDPQAQEDVRDSFTLLIPSDNLALALAGATVCEPVVVFTRLIGKTSQASGVFNLAVPEPFEVVGFDVTNTWEGMSVISSQQWTQDEWIVIREIVGRNVNDWNLITSGEAALRVAQYCNNIMPEKGPFAPVLYALCPAGVLEEALQADA